jgi:putative membrane protein
LRVKRLATHDFSLSYTPLSSPAHQSVIDNTGGELMKVQSIILSLALAAPVALVGPAMAQSNSGNNNDNMQSQQSQQSQLNSTDHQFLHKLAQEDQSEVNLAHLAMQKSNNPHVKDYAKNKILAADPSMEHQAKTIAEQNNAKVWTSPNSMDKQEYKKLSNMSGQQFDKAYMSYEARKQEADLDLVQREIKNTNNTQLKDYAQKEETPVREASQSAQQISSSLGTSNSASNSY